MNDELDDFLKSKDIEHELTNSYTLQHNDTVEHFMQTVTNAASTLLT